MAKTIASTDKNSKTTKGSTSNKGSKTNKGSTSNKSTKETVSKKKTEPDPEPSNDKKPSRFAGVEKGNYPNIATAFAGAAFNVEDTKRWMKSYYSSYKVVRKTKVDTTKGDDHVPKKSSETVAIKDAHFLLTACDQVVCLTLANCAANRSKKAGAGLYTITDENLTDGILLNDELRYTFERLLTKYDSHQNYSSQININKHTLEKFIEKYAFDGGNSNIILNDSAINLLMYLILQNRFMLAETAFQMTLYKKSASVTDRSILFSINTVYIGKLKNSLFKKAEDMSLRLSGLSPERDEGSETGSKSGSKKNTKDDDASNEEGSDEEGSDEEGSDDEGSDDEGSDDEGSDDEGSDDEDGDQDSEPESEPPKKVSKNTTKKSSSKK